MLLALLQNRWQQGLYIRFPRPSLSGRDDAVSPSPTGVCNAGPVGPMHQEAAVAFSLLEGDHLLESTCVLRVGREVDEQMGLLSSSIHCSAVLYVCRREAAGTRSSSLPLAVRQLMDCSS